MKEVTRNNFLRQMAERPFQFALPVREVPSAWMAAAWAIEAVRHCHTEDMARTVSKLGDLICDGEYVELLARSLTSEELVELFLRIRDCSPHRETEFRPGFERAFPMVAADLPPPLTRKEIADMVGEDLIDP